MTDDERRFLSTFVAERRWQFAKTMAHNPHEYTVRHWQQGVEADLAFDCFLTLVATKGYSGWFGNRQWPYLDVGDHTYFTFGAPLAPTYIINRKPLFVDVDKTTPSWQALGKWQP